MRPVPTSANHDVSLGAFLQAHRHAFTRQELLSRWPRSALDQGLRDGGISRIAPGVYCDSTHTTDPVAMGDAVNLWTPSGLVTGALALRLYSPALVAPSCADLLVPYGRHPRAPSWVRVRQTELPRASGSAQGIRCVVPERALLDAW